MWGITISGTANTSHCTMYTLTMDRRSPSRSPKISCAIMKVLTFERLNISEPRLGHMDHVDQSRNKVESITARHDPYRICPFIEVPSR